MDGQLLWRLMAMYKIQIENTAESFLECAAMGAQAQYDEIIAKGDSIPMKLDEKLMGMLVDAGMINLVVARDEDAKPIAYFLNLVDKDWLTSTNIAKEVAIFVLPEWRKSGVFSEMLKMQEEAMIKRECKVQMLEFQMGHNEKLPLSHGYSPVSINYEKHLGV